ncbi:MAG: PfkB family carbohydrate kinase [Planctomycetota bacterium]
MPSDTKPTKTSPDDPASLQARDATAKAAAAGLEAFAEKAPGVPVLVGFDGFVDSIIRVVQTRQDLDHYTAMPSIKSFGDKIVAADGKSANFEFVVTQQKLGGNGPIMANALLEATLGVSYIGALGHPNLHPVFEEFAATVNAGIGTAYSVADPGETDAAEFDNGKLMLGKYAHMAGLDAAMVENALGTATLEKLATESKLIGMTNWTMFPRVESLWKRVCELIPEYADATMKPYVFVDFADPAKRDETDLAGALKLLTQMQSKANVVLGLNLSEGTQVRKVLGLGDFGDDPGDLKARLAIETTCSLIRQKLNLTGVIVHPREAAAAAFAPGSKAGHGSSHQEETIARFAGPFVETPKLSTGAGDNFNAGFCLGLLAGLPLEQCLCTGVGTSGFYVRNARSPKLSELVAFCRELPPPEVV